MTVSHEITVAAPPDRVYALLADAAGWPALFPPTVHAVATPLSDGEERLQLWATANGAVKSWTSLRILDPVARRITFRQEVSAPPVASMGGEWHVEEAADGHSRVVLTHTYRAIDDDPSGLAWIAEAVERNSVAELAALEAGALADPGIDFTFSDSVEFAGSARDAHAFIWDAQHWPARLPHVVGVELGEEPAGVQRLRMETLAKDGSSHTTESIRVSLPGLRIVYKQTRPPALLSVHTGRWTFEERDGLVTATSQHRVVLRPSAVVPVLGEGRTVADARTFVREALGANSLATLRHVAGVTA
ncbi:SRPBCC family protein [Dactylosporangium maewongense]|uniref:SRPBCC family protein n=1 Tax=Dactylosporangium maewongense TaxID=634393 RepID=A0ABP4N8I7_9ACTN